MKKKLYTMTQVAEKTGMSPLLIRAWENRYGAVRPVRNESNRRLYSEEDIAKLVLLHQATQSGFRIGDIAPMSLRDLSVLMKNQTGKFPAGNSASSESDKVFPALKKPEEFISRWMALVKAMNMPAMEKLLEEASVQFSIPELIKKMIIPVTIRTGEDWQNGTVRIHEEHLATGLIRQFLANAQRSIRPNPGAPVIVIATPAGQMHDIGALIVALASATMGWNALHLGTNLPSEEIAAAASRINSSAVALSIVYPPADTSVMTEINRLRKLLPAEVPLLAGGQGTRLIRMDEWPPGVILLDDPFLLNDAIMKNRP